MRRHRMGRVALSLGISVAACSGNSSTKEDGGSSSPAVDGGDTAAAPDAGACASGRVTAERPDDVTGYQIKAMYVLPSDGVDEHLDTDGAIATSVAAISSWFAEQTGGPRLRFDTCGGSLDIGFARLPRSDAVIAATGAFVRDQIEKALPALGFADAKKIYAVYYGGSSSYACGGGPWPPALVGHVAALFLKGLPESKRPCASNPVGASPTTPGYFDFSIVHESLHAMGIVASCAPHHTMAGHVSDSPTDLMYAGPEPWAPRVLDIGHDDYFRHSIPGCVDLARSVFLDPLPENPTAPPAW